MTLEEFTAKTSALLQGFPPGRYQAEVIHPAIAQVEQWILAYHQAGGAGRPLYDLLVKQYAEAAHDSNADLCMDEILHDWDHGKGIFEEIFKETVRR